MNFKKKVTILSALVAVLAIVYILILFLESDRRRDPSFAWLEASNFAMADTIEIYGKNDLNVLRRINDTWFLYEDGIDYPARQSRVEDLIASLNRKEVYPIRAVSAEARERLGLVDGSASRIRIHGGAGLPLLDLLIGIPDTMGRQVFLKSADRNEIYSGEDRFTFFTEGTSVFWMDRRFFASASIADVQQIEVSLPLGAYNLRRSGGGWIMQGTSDEIDVSRVDSWLRGILEGEAEYLTTGSPDTIESTITLRMGDGQNKVILAGPDNEISIRQVLVSDSSFTYLLSEATYNRLFRESSYFLR